MRSFNTTLRTTPSICSGVSVSPSDSGSGDFITRLGFRFSGACGITSDSVSDSITGQVARSRQGQRNPSHVFIGTVPKARPFYGSCSYAGPSHYAAYMLSESTYTERKSENQSRRLGHSDYSGEDARGINTGDCIACEARQTKVRVYRRPYVCVSQGSGKIHARHTGTAKEQESQTQESELGLSSLSPLSSPASFNGRTASPAPSEFYQSIPCRSRACLRLAILLSRSGRRRSYLCDC